MCLFSASFAVIAHADAPYVTAAADDDVRLGE
jgi:hypothetical protein